MSPSLPVLKAREVVTALERAGFFIHHSTGSHVQLKHREHPELRITVPYHSGDVPRGTLRSIIRQAGLTVEQFSALI
ncbi:MAG TPA: type II toxin-antitoxin system HicA family toxin [Candidatus Binataceae bacterium]|nr:type II toxin-antitoxin system HicA family toxin [Candidatus Binataceae bacterium]